MESKTSLIDTSFLVSFFLDEDTNHKKALNLFEEVIQLDNLYITNYVFAELSTILSQRIGKKQFINILTQLDYFKIEELFVSKDLYNKTKKLYLGHSQKNISFIDLNLAVMSEEMKINSIVTFDKHFKRLSKDFGFEVIGI